MISDTEKKSPRDNSEQEKKTQKIQEIGPKLWTDQRCGFSFNVRIDYVRFRLFHHQISKE